MLPSLAETELLSLCARPRLDAQAVSRLHDLLRRDLDWARILRLAEGYRAIPLLSVNLQQHGGVLLSPALGQELQRLHKAYTCHNLALATQLLELVRQFAAAGIRVAAFKGPVAAVLIHGDLALRACGDLDLLVSPDDHAAAERLLVNLGYRVQERHPAALQSCLAHSQHHTAIDLHWGMPPRNLPLRWERLWDAVCTVPLMGQPVPTFCGPDCLLICALNAVKEYWKPSLHYLSDMARLTGEYSAEDWRGAFLRARELGCRRALAVAAVLANRLLDVPLPQGAPARLVRRRSIRRLADEVHAHLFPADTDTLSEAMKPLYHRSQTAYYLALTDSPWYRLGGWLRWALTPGDADRSLVDLPRGLAFLYYLLRPLRLLLKRL